MTLTTILPTLRASIPDPLAANRWPDHTRATLTDLVVDGLSMNHLVQLAGTPAIYPSRTPGLGVVTLVVLGARRTGDRCRELTVDLHLETVRPRWPELRLMGRVSTARVEKTVIHDAANADCSAVLLPADIEVADVLIVPCEMSLDLWAPESVSSDQHDLLTRA